MGAEWSRTDEQQGSVEVTGTVGEWRTPFQDATCNRWNCPSKLDMLKPSPQWDYIWRCAFKEIAKVK